MVERRNVLSVFLSLLLIFILLSGCTPNTDKDNSTSSFTSAENANTTKETVNGTTETTDDAVEISWATWALSEESLYDLYMSMIETFMEEHQNVNVSTVTYPYSQYKDQLMIAVAGGNAPTFAHIKADWAKDFYDTGNVLNLKKAMSEEIQNDYYPNILEAASVDGNIIAAPWFNSPSAMFYNKTLLEKADITELPKTWDELIEDAYKVSELGIDENGNKVYGTVLPNAKGEYGASFISMPYLWSNDGGYGNNDNTNISMDLPGNLEAFEQIQKLYQDGVSPNGCSMVDACNLFAQGVVGFCHYIQTGVSTFASASPLGEAFAGEYGVMPIPGDGNKNGSGYLTEHYIIFFDNGTISEKNYSVVNDLVDWFSGENVMRILYDAGQGKIPSRNSIAQLDIFTDKADDVTKVFVEAAATCHSLPVSDPNFAVVDEYIVDALAELASTNKTPEIILNELIVKISELY